MTLICSHFFRNHSDAVPFSGHVSNSYTHFRENTRYQYLFLYGQSKCMVDQELPSNGDIDVDKGR